jgi:hypothetical protein
MTLMHLAWVAQSDINGPFDNIHGTPSHLIVDGADVFAEHADCQPLNFRPHKLSRTVVGKPRGRTTRRAAFAVNIAKLPELAAAGPSRLNQAKCRGGVMPQSQKKPTLELLQE